MHQLVAYDACVLWWRFFINSVKVSIMNASAHVMAIPIMVWLPWALLAAAIIYMILRKYASEEWRSEREMKKKIKMQQEQEIGDFVVEGLLRLQGRGVLTATDVNKYIKRIGGSLNMADLLPKWRERHTLSQEELKKRLREKHQDKLEAKRVDALKQELAEKPKSTKERVRGILNRTSTARAM